MYRGEFMSFVRNNISRLTLFDKGYYLTSREQEFLKKSYAYYFSEYIFPKIDETPFAAIYSDSYSRPNTPVNIQIGALMLKELTHSSDEEILYSLMLDYRMQYALHTTSFDEQPMSDRTLGRFRARCLEYERKTGIDIIGNTIKSLSKEIEKLMDITGPGYYGGHIMNMSMYENIAIWNGSYEDISKEDCVNTAWTESWNTVFSLSTPLWQDRFAG